MIGDKLPPEPAEDRKSILGIDLGQAATAPEWPLQIQRLRAHFHWLAQVLSDGRPFLLGAEASAADLSAHRIMWLLRRNLGAEIDALVPLARTQGWYERVGAVGQRRRRDMPASEALDVAAVETPVPPDFEAGEGEAFGLTPGWRVGVALDDTGRDPVVGTLIATGAEGIVLRLTNSRLGEVSVHFPRAGYGTVPA